MKTSIKTTIGIITIVMSSLSVAQAGQDHHERAYDKPQHERHFRENERQRHWKHAHKRKAHFRDHSYNDRHSHRHLKAYKQLRRNHSGWRHGDRHVEKRIYRHSGRHHAENHGFLGNTYTPPRHGVSQVIIRNRHHNNRVLPVLAGGLIGSSIGNSISHGDPVATFGGAVFGAIIGDAISHH